MKQREQDETPLWKLPMIKGNVSPCWNHDWHKWCFYCWCCCRCDRTHTSCEKMECTDGGCRRDGTDTDVNRIDTHDIFSVKRMITLLCVTKNDKTWRQATRLREASGAMGWGTWQLQGGMCDEGRYAALFCVWGFEKDIDGSVRMISCKII